MDRTLRLENVDPQLDFCNGDGGGGREEGVGFWLINWRRS